MWKGASAMYSVPDMKDTMIVAFIDRISACGTVLGDSPGAHRLIRRENRRMQWFRTDYGGRVWP